MKKKKKVAMGQQSYPLGDVVKRAIDYLLLHNFHFVFFKYPLDSNIYLLLDDDENQQEEYIFQSFDKQQEIKLKGRLYTNENISEVTHLRPRNNEPKTAPSDGQYMDQTTYEAYVQAIVGEIKNGKLSKCVAARKKKVSLSDSFKPSTAFVNMYLKYDETYAYLSHTEAGLWMGATPELLLYKKESRYFTISLAGTKRVTAARDWSPKEKVEQEIVTDYIIDRLKKLKVRDIERSPVFTTRAGHLNHLKTTINFYADKSLHEELHPTPAVCGLPVKEAQEFILKHEGESRSLYTGLLGIAGEHSRYYVNLRCMRIFNQHVDIYVGAGITIDSDPSAEWQETEAKAETMKNVIKL